MAYNSWEPTLDGLEGNTMAQPRVFGHDALALTAATLQGALTVTNGGSGFDSSDIGDTVAQSGASAPSGGSGATFNITEVTGNAVTGVELTSSATGGTGYAAGMVITLAAATSGGSGCQITVSATGANIPNTGKRGAVIYSGKNAAQDITIVTEAGTEVEFKNVQPGTVVGQKAPMLATKLIEGTQCVAIY